MSLSSVALPVGSEVAADVPEAVLDGELVEPGVAGSEGVAETLGLDALRGDAENARHDPAIGGLLQVHREVGAWVLR